MKRSIKLSVLSLVGLLFLSTLSSCSSDNKIKDEVNNKHEEKLDFGTLVGDYKIDVTGNFNSSIVQQSTKLNDQEVSIIVEMDGSTKVDTFLDSKSKKYASVNEYSESASGISLNNKLVKNQASLAKSLIKNKLISKTKGNYTVLMNGFAAVTTYGNVEEIRNFPGVQNVYVSTCYAAPTSTVTTNNSGCDEDTGIAMNDSEYQGEGMLVAVLDSGLDYTHPAFKSDVTSPKISKDDVSSVIDKMACQKENSKTLTADDVYISRKVPFAYDYADNDADVLPAESDHGTHVSGIIVGNEEGVFSGVTPQAQVAFMKVFADEEEKASSDVILLAMEDAVLLGVDAMNESLGSLCGYSEEYGLDGDVERLNARINEIYSQVHDLGISMVVAAGNDYYQQYATTDGSNRVENPESSNIGSPGSYRDSFTVASIESNKIPYLYADNNLPFSYTEAYNNKGTEYNLVDMIFEKYNFKNPLSPKDPNTDSLDLDYVVIDGLGSSDDFDKYDVKGKVALVKRGTLTFEDKITAALNAGAYACLIYNNTSGIIRMTCGDSLALPAASISNSIGEKLAARKTGKLQISKSYKFGPFMSDFSSLGPNPDLTIKPEITSCGGDVLSAVIGGSYEEFSGTSMACPNTCGMVLALRQYIKANWTKLTGKSESEMTNVAITTLSQQLLMSTAKLCMNEYGDPYSPRKQGAGMALLSNCLNANTYLHVNDSDKVKLELGDDKKKTGVYTLEFNVKNISDTASTYSIDDLTFTESTSSDGKTVSNAAYMLSPETNINVSNNLSLSGNTITVPAHTDGKVTVTLTLSNDDKNYINKTFPNGMFVEGYVTLTATSANDVDLSIPFLAFYGDWSDAPMWDLTYYDVQTEEYYNKDIEEKDRLHAAMNEITPYGQYGDFYMIPLGGYVYSIDKNKYPQIMATEDKASISLFNDAIYDFYTISGGLLRSAKTIKCTISDATSGEVLMEKTTYNNRKDSFYQSGGQVLGFSEDYTFSALENNIANNTKLKITFQATLDYGDGTAKDGDLEFTFYVDYEAPTLENVEYYKELDATTGKYKYYVDLTVYDNRYAMSVSPCVIQPNYKADSQSKYTLSMLGKNIPIYQEAAGQSTTMRVDITDYMDVIINSATPDTFYVYLDDYAMNYSLYYISLNGSEFKDLTFKTDEIVISQNEVIDLNEYANLDNAMLEGFTWTTNAPKVAQINNGQIYGLSRGIATAYGSSTYGTTISVKIKVLGPKDDGYVEYPAPKANSISIMSYKVLYSFDDDAQPSTIGQINSTQYDLSSISLYPGEKIKLDYLIGPWYVDSTDSQVIWKSTSASVASISDDGILLGKSAGKATINLYLVVDGKQSRIKDAIHVEVKEGLITSNTFLQYYKGVSETVVLPRSLNLKYIYSFAFSLYNYATDAKGSISQVPVGNPFIKHITLPTDIETIYPYAFAKLTSLEDINIPYTTVELQNDTFAGDTSLKTVDIPDNSKLIKICFNSFRNCTSLETINLKNVVTIGSYAFANCTSLETVDLTNLKYYGSHSFDGCTSLKNIVMTENTAIGEYMFANTGVETLTLPQSYISEGAFANCKNLTSITFTNPNVVIGKDAFKGCDKLTSITFADGSTISIKDGAFQGTSISNFECPNGNVLFGKDVFKQTPLETLTLNSNSTISFASSSPFKGTQSFANIVINGTNDNYVCEENVLYSTDKKTLVLVPTTKVLTSLPTVETIGQASLGNNKSTALTLASIKTIGSYAFSNSSIESIDFANNDIDVNEYAFFNAKNLKELTNVNFSSISTGAFSGSSISTVAFGEGAIITSYSFANIATLSNITLSSNTVIEPYAFFGSFVNEGGIVTTAGATNISISEYAFANSNIKNIDLKSVTKIGDSAFKNAVLLENADLTNVTSLGKNSFEGCKALTNIKLGDAITTLPEYSFNGCDSLATIDLNKVNVIDQYALANNKSLQTVTSLENVATIGYHAFDSDVSLIMANLSGVTSLGNYAFVGCESLDTVTLPTTLEEISSGAFNSCSKLETINTSNIKVIHDYAFASCFKLTNPDLSSVVRIEDSAFANSALFNANLKECTYLGVFALYSTSLSTLSMPKMEYIDSFALASTKLTEVNLPNSLTHIGACAFYSNSYLVKFVAEDKVSTTNNCWLIDNDVLYIKNTDGSLTLESYPVKKQAEEYVIIDNTTRIQESSFAYNSFIKKVTISSSVEVIGDSAFYNCESLLTYVFNGMKAPTLEGYYSSGLISYIGSLTTLPETFEEMYGHSYWFVYYFYNNFYDYLGLNDEVPLTIVYDKNATGYDTFVYDLFFKNKVLLNATYTVSFDTDGGSEITPVEVSTSNTVTMPKAPVKEGYEFVKWVDQDGNDFDFSTEITKDITLTAVYQESTVNNTPAPKKNVGLIVGIVCGTCGVIALGGVGFVLLKKFKKVK